MSAVNGLKLLLSRLLAVSLLLSSCYQPVSFDDVDTPAVPCVYCIIDPADSLQQAELYYLFPTGHPDPKGITNAKVTLTGRWMSGIAYHDEEAEFSPSGDGIWQLNTSSLDSRFFKVNTELIFQAVLPSGDTVKSSLHVVPDAITETLPAENGHFRFRIIETPAVWLYGIKEYGTASYGSVLDSISTDREDIVDAFNKNGGWHYRYLRLMDGRSLVSWKYRPPHDSYLDPYPIHTDTITVRCNESCHIRAKMVSLEYDRYLRELAQQELIENENADIAGIYSNTNVYTNISGGTGIFGFEITRTF